MKAKKDLRQLDTYERWLEKQEVKHEKERKEEVIQDSYSSWISKIVEKRKKSRK